METSIKAVLELCEAISRLKSLGKSIKDLPSQVTNLEAIFLTIQNEKSAGFDCPISILDSQSGDKLFQLPGKTTPNAPIALFSDRFTLQQLEDIIYGRIKTSEVICSQKRLEYNKSTINQYLKKDFSSTWKTLKDRACYKTSQDKVLYPKELDESRRYLREQNLVWCTNVSCTGKTWLGIMTIEEEFPGYKQYACNFGSHQFMDMQSLNFILDCGSECCVLIDDMQCDIELCQKLLSFILENYIELKARHIYIYMISWSKMLEEKMFQQYKSDSRIYKIKTQPERYLNLLKRDIPEKLADVCGDNLSLLSKAATIGKQRKQSDEGYKDTLFYAYVNTSDNNQVYLAYICAVLGVYEYETPISFLDRFNLGLFDPKTLRTSKIFVDRTMPKSGSDHRNTYIHVAHRKICEFIAQYIEEKRDVFKLELTRRDILKQYILYLDGTLKWKALVHLVGAESKSEISSFGFIWNLLNKLVKYLREESAKDPTWQHTPSSMYFVMAIANYLNVIDEDEFKAVVNEFANCFIIEGNHIKVKFDSLQTKWDFESIQELMIEEDNQNGCQGYERGENLDKELMHSNWLLSFIVGSTQILNRFGYADLASVAKQELLNRQLENGAWYPARVPWITGCILRCLPAIELNIQNDNVKKAYEYLLSRQEENGSWKAHTGTWNTPYETTSICLDGLWKCGAITNENQRVGIALHYLEEAAEKWMAPSNAIDGSATACLLMNINGVNDYLMNYIQELTNSNVQALLDNSKNLQDTNKLQTETCKSALICYYIIELCWNILELDLQGIMDEFMKGSDFDVDKLDIYSEGKQIKTESGININTICGPVQIITNGNGKQINI